MGSYRKGLCLSIASIAVLILLAIPVFAQLPTATILGVAKDSSGGVLPNVTVTITNVDTGIVRTVKTSDDGEYRALELPVGRYEVRAEHAGFKTVTRKGITLEVTQQAVINLDFEVGAADQQVVVTEEAPMVNTQDATLGGTVNETKMSRRIGHNLNHSPRPQLERSRAGPRCARYCSRSNCGRARGAPRPTCRG